MGAYLSSPITDKESEDGECGRLRFGVSAMQVRALCSYRVWIDSIRVDMSVHVQFSAAVFNMCLLLRLRPHPPTRPGDLTHTQHHT